MAQFERPQKFIGASTDTKPTHVRHGSTFYEYNTKATYITHDGGTTWTIKLDFSPLTEVRVANVIDATADSYVANDVVSADDCHTDADPWIFTGMARANGGYGIIVSATIFSETASVTPRLTLYLFNATPTGERGDNNVNTSPIAADRTKYIGKIDFPALESLGTTASSASATPSTVGGLPLGFKCASTDKNLYGILVTRDIFIQVATNDIEITLSVEQM